MPLNERKFVNQEAMRAKEKSIEDVEKNAEFYMRVVKEYIIKHKDEIEQRLGTREAPEEVIDSIFKHLDIPQWLKISLIPILIFLIGCGKGGDKGAEKSQTVQKQPIIHC